MENTPLAHHGEKTTRDVAKLLTMPNMTFSALKKLGVVSKHITSPSSLGNKNSDDTSSRLFRKLQNKPTNESNGSSTVPASKPGENAE